MNFMMRRALLYLLAIMAVPATAMTVVDRYESGSPYSSLDGLEQAAASGNAQAQFELGQYYQYFAPPEQRDLVKAGHYYQLAAAQDHIDAEEMLGMFYSGGVGGFPVSCAKSIEWYERASTESNTAMLNLAWKLATCEDFKLRDGARALKLVRQSARETSHFEEISVLDTLAAAYAAMGDFEQARALQFAAVKLLELKTESNYVDAERLQAFRKRLALYRSNQTWRGASFSDPKNFRE